MRQRVSLSQRVVVANSLQVNEMGSLVNLTIKIVGLVTSIQLIGAMILYARFSSIFPPSESIFLSIAHSVSSFNNAGFVFFNDSNFAKVGVIAVANALGAYDPMVDAAIAIVYIPRS